MVVAVVGEAMCDVQTSQAGGPGPESLFHLRPLQMCNWREMMFACFCLFCLQKCDRGMRA